MMNLFVKTYDLVDSEHIDDLSEISYDDKNIIKMVFDRETKEGFFSAEFLLVFDSSDNIAECDSRIKELSKDSLEALPYISYECFKWFLELHDMLGYATRD